MGQLPVYYNRPLPAAHDYVEMSAKPLYPFGFGLSYTTFEYSGLTINKSSDGGWDVTFEVTNSGSMAGEEVVQLYLRDRLSSVVQPERTLKAFERISLQPGEVRTITLHLDRDAFAIVDANMQWTLEPGIFDVWVGASSEDIRLKGEIDAR